MAMVKFTKGTLANLGTVEKVAGQVLITTDERAMYLDLSSTQRIRIGDFQEYASWAAIQAIPAANLSTTALYYAAAENILAKYTGSGWTQINAQKDLAALGGVSKAEYDAKVKDLGDAIDGKVDKVTGKSLVDDAEITKLAGVSAGANKVESAGNGKIKIDGVETTVYTHPDKHAISEVEGLQDALDGKQAAGDYATKTEAQAMADGKDGAIAAAKKAGDDAAAALETYKGTNDAAVKKAQDTADAKVASVTAADASVTVAGTATAPTVAVKLDPSADNAIKMSDAGLKVEIGAAPEYTIVKAEDSGEFAAVYNLTKDGTIVGASINIPKDLVVKSGSVVGDEIVLVLNDEAGTEIKIPVASLIEYVTSGSQTGDMVVVNVSDDHKVTATITDGTITLAKLHTDVQTAIGQAHTHENAAVLADISADDVDNWDGAQAAAEATAAAALAAAKSELEGKITAAQTAAEGHADGLNTAMDTRVKVLEGIDHDAYKAADTALQNTLNAEIAKKADASVVSDMDTAYKAADTALAGRIEKLEKNEAGYATTAQVDAAKAEAATDAANKDAVVLAEAQKSADAVQTALNTYKDANDAEVAKKANAADVYAKTETYTKDQVDALVEAAYTWGSF